MNSEVSGHLQPFLMVAVNVLEFVLLYLGWAPRNRLSKRLTHWLPAHPLPLKLAGIMFLGGAFINFYYLLSGIAATFDGVLGLALLFLNKPMFTDAPISNTDDNADHSGIGHQNHNERDR